MIQSVTAAMLTQTQTARRHKETQQTQTYTVLVCPSLYFLISYSPWADYSYSRSGYLLRLVAVSFLIIGWTHRGGNVFILIFILIVQVQVQVSYCRCVVVPSLLLLLSIPNFKFHKQKKLERAHYGAQIIQTPGGVFVFCLFRTKNWR